MNKILGYLLTVFSILLFISLIVCMILIKKDFMKYILLITSYSSAGIFLLGTYLLRKGKTNEA